MPSVLGSVTTGFDRTPPAHTACLTAGATGTTSSQVVPFSSTVRVGVGVVDPGPAVSERAPSVAGGQRRRTVTVTSTVPSPRSAGASRYARQRRRVRSAAWSPHRPRAGGLGDDGVTGTVAGTERPERTSYVAVVSSPASSHSAWTAATRHRWRPAWPSRRRSVRLGRAVPCSPRT